MILHFITTVIGLKPREIEILVNTVHKYNLYRLPIIGIATHETGRVRDYICMKRIINSVYNLKLDNSINESLVNAILIN